MPTRDDSRNSTLDLAQLLERIEEHLAALRAGNGKSPQEWLTVKEVAEELKVSRDTIERIIASGKLQATAIETPKGRGKRGRYRVRRDWMEDFMMRQVRRRAPTSNGRSRRCRRAKPDIDFIG